MFGEWVFRSVPDRLGPVTTLFGLFARAGLKTGHLYTLPGYEAVAHWVPPDVEMMGEKDVETFRETVRELLGAETRRVCRAFRAIVEAHPQGVPHFYLVALATRPEHQNRGFGSALLRHVLDACDRQRLPAYLESSTQRNRALYERHGFRPTTEIVLPDGPSLLGMWREPAS